MADQSALIVTFERALDPLQQLLWELDEAPPEATSLHISAGAFDKLYEAHRGELPTYLPDGRSQQEIILDGVVVRGWKYSD